MKETQRQNMRGTLRLISLMSQSLPEDNTLENIGQMRRKIRWQFDFSKTV
jgi:hypothetical protein